MSALRERAKALETAAKGTVGGLAALMEAVATRAETRLASGETRSFLEDGDEVLFRARCSRTGFRTIGFGECRAIILPARP